jgi:hypothetical protein
MADREYVSADQQAADLYRYLFGPGTIEAHHHRMRAAQQNRETFPDGCGLCGEQADAEMGEFWQPEANNGQGAGVVAHGQCGIDAGLEMA